MKEVVGAQGEVTIYRLKELPAALDTSPVERCEKGWIVSHSETGHHHILTGGEVMERKVAPAGMRILYAILRDPASFVQDAPVPHKAHDLPPGIYEFRIAREYDPFAEQARIVRD